MNAEQPESSLQKQHHREFRFTPRIINAVKIAHAVIFSADEYVRAASALLKEYMPWVQTTVMSNPSSVSNYRSDQASVLIFDDTAINIVDTERIRRNNKDVICVLLSFNILIHCSPPSVAKEKYPYTAKADLIFAVNRSEFAADKIITSVVRAAEDLINIGKYSQVQRFIFLIVDDEPRWFSQFLPVLYTIIGQRADVMIARTYEETIKFLFGVDHESEIDEREYRSLGHGDDVVCLITDIFFPRGKDLSSNAGRDLIELINKYYPRIPVIIASKAKEVGSFKEKGFILPKGDPGSLETLKDYILDHTGIGDFIIRSKTGKELHRIKDIREMFEILLEAEKDTRDAYELREIFEMYGEKDNFSTWLYMHSFRELGDKLRPRRHRGQGLVAVLKRHLKREMVRTNSTPLIVHGNKIFNLQELLHLLHTIDPAMIQEFSDTDIFSSWLDLKGYSELAEELRPIHGSGEKMAKALADHVEKWMNIYQERERVG